MRKDKRTNKKIDNKLFEWIEKFIEQYRPALEVLAKK